MITQSEFRNPKYKVLILFAREALGVSESVPIEFFPFEGRGSDRTFFRLKWNGTNSAILIHYEPRRVENTYYADIAIFLSGFNIPVPELIRHDPDHFLILMEDLGDTDLYAFNQTPWKTRKTLYQKTLTIAHRLHTISEKDFPSDRVRLMEPFNPDLYQWEQHYFMDHFVRDVCKLNVESSSQKELEAELSSLGERLARTKRALIHRDLQSQNVMICNGAPFLIDFQGMRFGSPFYDLSSLLCDPYMNFFESEQEELLSFYYGLSKLDLDWPVFKNTFWEASAQRLMQALGAYGFLGLKKRLKAFLEHIPTGLQYLERATTQVISLPQLKELSQKCSGLIGEKRDVL